MKYSPSDKQISMLLGKYNGTENIKGEGAQKNLYTYNNDWIVCNLKDLETIFHTINILGWLCDLVPCLKENCSYQVCKQYGS